MAKQLPPDLLERIGEALYGREDWQASLARDLDMASRTISRWRSGQSKVPPSVTDELSAMIRLRRDALEGVANELAALPDDLLL